jgi:hypothetical protein
MKNVGQLSHPNEQLLRTNYAAFASGDVQPLMDSLTDDVHWNVSGPSPVAGRYLGKDEILTFFGKMMDLYGGTLRLEVVDVFANDRNGVVLTREQGEHAGKALKYTGVHCWNFRDGKCARFENLYDDAYQAFWRRA